MARTASLLAATVAVVFAVTVQTWWATAAAVLVVMIVLAAWFWRSLDAPPSDQAGHRYNPPSTVPGPGEDPGIGPGA
jgi:hypothetical protein